MNIDQETGEVIPPFIRTPFNYDTKAASLETGLACTDETRTQIQFADEVDINQIMERFGITGEMPPIAHIPTDADFTNVVTDYQTAMNMVVETRETFMTLPAKARARFDNDPQKFMDFMADRDNLDEAARLGIVVKKPDEPIIKKEEKIVKDE